MLSKVVIITLSIIFLTFLSSVVYHRGYNLGIAQNSDYREMWNSCMEREDKWLEFLREYRSKVPIQGSSVELQPAEGL